MLKLNFILIFCLFPINIYADAVSVPQYSITQATRSTLSPAKALMKLRAGNARYLDGKTRQHDYLKQSRYAAKHGQSPFAFILSCMDSRSIPEIAFDQGVGSIFTARVAGNVVDRNMLGSMEYAAYVGTKIFVVMGHTQCGAIKAACANTGFGNISQLLSEINPAVKQFQKNQATLNCNDPATLNAIATNNVKNMITLIKKESPYLTKKIVDKEIAIVGALHNIKTGKVFFINK